MGRLDGKIALITGAGGGLGTAMAVACAREGATVVCHDVREDAARTTAQAAQSAAGDNGRALAWACDVTDGEAVEEMFAGVTSRHGAVDVLVNNAGVQHVPGDGGAEVNGLDQLLAMSHGAWRAMLDVHLGGAFLCSRAMIHHLLASGRPGSIICISSITPLTGYGPIHYSAAKAGLVGFVRTLAVYGGRHRIRANAICPGMISTPMTADEAQNAEWMRRRTPLKRVGAPEDIAPLVVYLASDESSFVTAQSISPNGGVIPH
jgi:3-oxoacyl-[acyl-carrier protein] reductase